MGAEATRGDSDFAREVQDALAHLYDPVYLQVHPLASYLPLGVQRSNDAATRGRALRQYLVEAIESLAPGATLSGRGSRGYEILRLRYLEGLEPAVAQDRLALGKSQYYADHARALQAVVSALRARLAWAAEGVAEPRRAASTRSAAPDRPPRPLTRFVGRQREVTAIAEILAREHDPARLLMLTGPPGSGKSRLALEVAARVDRTVNTSYADVATAEDPAAALSVIAESLGCHALTEIRVPPTAATLLVLDNCEHLRSIGPDVAALVRAQPGLQVLATSRVPFEVYGERQFPVEPLALPPESADLREAAQSEAVCLYLDRARAVQPELTLTEQNVNAVVSICRRLDGLPLAIELAAAQTVALSCEAIERRLADRLALLTGGPRDRAPRQQTLRGALAWSYELLDAPHQQLFRRLAVFRGSCSPEAVRAVCDPHAEDVLAGLAHLTMANLLRRDPDGPDGEPRFRMLETIREYARERLEASGEADAVQRRHAEYFVAHRRPTWASIAQPETRIATADDDNLRAALESVLRDLVDSGSSMECRGAALALDSLGLLSFGRGDQTRARSYYLRSLAAYDAMHDVAGRALILARLGDVARVQDDPAQARLLYEQALALAATRSPGHLRALLGLAYLASAAGAFVDAQACCMEVRAVATDATELAALAEALAVLAAASARSAEAVQLLQAAQKVRMASGAELAPVERRFLERAVGPLSPETKRAHIGLEQAIAEFFRGESGARDEPEPG